MSDNSTGSTGLGMMGYPVSIQIVPGKPKEKDEPKDETGKQEKDED